MSYIHKLLNHIAVPVWANANKPGSFLGDGLWHKPAVPLKWIGLAPTNYRFYRTWVKVRPVGSTKSCRPKANPTTSAIRLTVQERTGECLRYVRVNANARAGCRPACLITKLERSLPKDCKRSSCSSCRCGLLYVCTTAGDGILTLIAVSTWGTFMLHVSGWDMVALDWVHDIWQE
ncbi:hypothetical protein PIB30_082303 [Stylosanthes scabra]|uniref:Uncharacterized protein n=1 Tax=Stylosanthes scabra TaxID=79078 RepID=A0ABU6WRP9_9FABA|nr:hypothetical protein [Stylosanthes scabra]